MTENQLHEAAVILKTEAEKDGLTATLSLCKSSIVSIPISTSLMGTDIDDFNLSVRARNGLMRAGLNTVGKVVNTIMSDKGLSSIRNLGRM